MPSERARVQQAMDKWNHLKVDGKGRLYVPKEDWDEWVEDWRTLYDAGFADMFDADHDADEDHVVVEATGTMQRTSSLEDKVNAVLSSEGHVVDEIVSKDRDDVPGKRFLITTVHVGEVMEEPPG